MPRSLAMLMRVIAIACGVTLLPVVATPVRGAGNAPNRVRPFVSGQFGDYMVLQRGRANRFWGWTEPGATVVLRMDGEMRRGTADATGRWALEIVPTGDEAVEHTVTIEGRQRVQFQHVVIGNVWVCVGPPTRRSTPGRPDCADDKAVPLDRTRVRFFISKGGDAEEVSGRWIVCPGPLEREGSGVCAAAYSLACLAQTETGQPVGVVQDFAAALAVERWLDPATDGGELARAR